MNFVVRVKDFNSGVDFCLNGVGKDKNRPLTAKLHIVVAEGDCYMESCNGNILTRYRFPVVYEGEGFDFTMLPIKYTTTNNEAELLFHTREDGSVVCVRDGVAGDKVTETVSPLSEEYFDIGLLWKQRDTACERVKYTFDPKVLIKGLRGFAKEESVDLYVPTDRKEAWYVNDRKEDNLIGILMPMRVEDDNSTS